MDQKYIMTVQLEKSNIDFQNGRERFKIALITMAPQLTQHQSPFHLFTRGKYLPIDVSFFFKNKMNFHVL